MFAEAHVPLQSGVVYTSTSTLCFSIASEQETSTVRSSMTFLVGLCTWEAKRPQVGPFEAFTAPLKERISNAASLRLGEAAARPHVLWHNNRRLQAWLQLALLLRRNKWSTELYGW